MPTTDYRFDLTACNKGKKTKTSVDSFCLRETNGQDEDTAASLARSKGPAASMLEELVRLSIVKVNDAPVEQPYAEVDTWSSRTRTFLMNAYKSINGINGEEGEDFLASATPVQRG